MCMDRSDFPKNYGSSALDKQVGGSHYVDCKFQPIEYIVGNGLSFCEGNIVKYITRHKAKGGRADVEKVIHYAQLLLELEYPKEKTAPEVIIGPATGIRYVLSAEPGAGGETY